MPRCPGWLFASSLLGRMRSSGPPSQAPLALCATVLLSLVIAVILAGAATSAHPNGASAQEANGTLRLELYDCESSTASGFSLALGSQSCPAGLTRYTYITNFNFNGPGSNISPIDGDPFKGFTLTVTTPGTYSLSVRSGDGAGLSLQVTIVAGQTTLATMVHYELNVAPTLTGANPQAVTTAEDTLLGITIATTDPDSTLTYTPAAPAHGTVTPGSNTTGSFTYTPAANYFGPDSFTVSVSDGFNAPVVATVNVTVTSVNDPPVATDDTLPDATEDTPFDIPYSALFANDSPGPGEESIDSLGYGGIGPGTGGNVVDLGTGLRFTPTPGYSGPASFGYRIFDEGSETATAIVRFTILAVNDPPVIDEGSIPTNQTIEATSSAGATVTFTPPTATDPDTGDMVTVLCDPASGTTFPLGETEVTCTATDTGDLTDEASFTVTVEDTTAPTVTVPANITTEATSSAGATVTYTATAIDLVDGPITPVCTPVSGTVFPIGTTTVSCTATDSRNNTSAAKTFTVTVEDTTAPALTVPANITAEATGPAGATVTYTATATDLVDGPVTPVCSPASGSVFPIGTTTVSCTATDSRNNTSATKTFTVTVRDTTGPAITWVGGPQPNRSYTQATLPGEPTCTATDVGSVVTQCRVYGYSTAVGTHTLTARARDRAGNSSVSTRTYTVTASAPTVTPRPTTAPTATPRPTSVPPTATPARPVRPTTAPVQPTATPVTPVVPPTVAPTRPPRR